MNLSTNSECSSGCESGWTMYLDQLSDYSTDPYYNYEKLQGAENNIQEDDDEDLSMVSDASSGPPTRYYNELYEINYNYNYGLYASASVANITTDHDQAGKKKISKRKNTINTKEATLRQKNVCLDDTASSPVFRFSQDNVASTVSRSNSIENVPGFSSSEDFEGESVKKKHLSNFFKSSTKGKSGSFLGRKRI